MVKMIQLLQEENEEVLERMEFLFSFCSKIFIIDL